MSASDGNTSTEAGDPNRAYLASLPEEYRLMLQVRDNVFGGSWKKQLSSMRKPLEKPSSYTYRKRLIADIERVEEMRGYELEQGVNLADYF